MNGISRADQWSLSMDLINLKSVGIDPVKVEAIQENALTVTRNAAWISEALVSAIQQLGEKFSLKLPAPPQS
jgi:hypothetical protein